MLELLADWATRGALGYVAVAIAAATPWLEVLVVVPPAILLDLNPGLVGVTAFLGNYAPVVGIVAGWSALAERWARRRGQVPGAGSGRSERGRKILVRYGVPGLALLGPLVTGVHLAAVLALATGAPRRSILTWTGGSLAVWTIGLTAATVAGVEAFSG